MQVVHGHQVDREEVVEDVDRRMLNDFLLLAQEAENGLGEDKDAHQWQKDNCVDQACSVKVDSAEPDLVSTRGLSDQCLQGPVHAHYNVEGQAFKQGRA